MDEEYDVLVCGTGFTECILSGLLSVTGKKVLHVDRNNYYGGEAASLNLEQLWQKFRNKEPPADMGRNRDWNIDLIPKFVMADGLLTRILITSGVHEYMQWRVVDATYVYQYQASGLFSNEKFFHKIPSNEMEAVKSPLMGLMEKKRFIDFFKFVLNFDDRDKSTWQDLHPDKVTTKKLFEHFGLNEDTQDFIGHTVALWPSDDYLKKAYRSTIDACGLYWDSVSKSNRSPFIYPEYGLGNIPQAFSRLSAVFAGTFMLNKPVDELLFDGQGKVCGMRSGNESVKAKAVICDPSYLTGGLTSRLEKTGRSIRMICILSHPIKQTSKAESCQIIFTARQMKRKSDIYVMMVSSSQMVAPQGKYVAIISTTVETSNPEKEVEPVLNLLEPIDQKFVEFFDEVRPMKAPTDNLYVSKSYDAQSHFESATQDVLRIWNEMMGEELNLEKIQKQRKEIIDNAQKALYG